MRQTMTHQARELVLHAGLAKTGSSAIQRALFASKQALLEKCGLLFPGEWDNHFLLQAAFSEDPAAQARVEMLGLHGRHSALEYLRRYRESLLNEIETARPRRIVISSEYFTAMSVPELQSMREFLEPLAKIIVPMVYVRDPWSHAISTIQELIRAGRLDHEVPLGYVMSNVEIIDKIERAFGRRVNVAPYGPQMQGGQDFNVVADFCQRLAIPSSVIDPSRYTEVNAAMRRETAVALLHLNRMFPTYGPDGHYIADPARDWMIEALVSSPLPRTPIRPSKATAQAIYDESRTDLARLQFRYFGGSTVLQDQFKSVLTIDEADELKLESASMVKAYDYLFQCMRSLAEKAAEQFVDRVFWTGKFYRAEGNLTAAAACFKELLSFSPEHARRQEAIAELVAIEAALSPAAAEDPA
jgi:hypothetical protein